MLGPIFGRESLTLPRRPRHYGTRAALFGAMWVLLLTVWQTTVGWERTPTLGDNARFALLAFQVLGFVQLVLLLFFSALSAASTISQEKDRRTFVLLLMTDLSNFEIVMGKIAGSLLQIVMLLAGTLPIFMFLHLMGGVAPGQVIQTLVILGTTALAAGSLGGLVALWREKTFQALSLTVLFLVFYLVVARGLGVIGWLISGDSGNATLLQTIQSCLDPFIALERVLDAQQRALPFASAYGFGLAMLAISVLLNGFGIWKLRVWNPSGEPIIQRDSEVVDAEATEKGRSVHAAPGRVRPVWANPILWREVVTRAYGRRPLMVKAAYFVVVGLIAWYGLGVMETLPFHAARTLIPVIVLSLLLAAAQAVTSITSERDLGALDLLMVTDLTPHEFIFGKLLGVLWNVKEYLIPPIILVVIFAIRGQLANPPTPQRNFESGLGLVLGWAILAAFTMMLGLHVALHTINSRTAAILTLGAVFFLSVGTLVCIYLILINGQFEYQWLSFSGFIFAGVGGMWYVLAANRPSAALTLASWICPFAVFYTITNVLIGRVGLGETSDPLIPFVVTGGSFGFAVAAMLVPLLHEFDVAIGRTNVAGD